MPIVLLIRHAQASFGAADYDLLSDRGRAQVHALRRALERRRIVADRPVSGSMRRQRATARPWADALGAAMTIDERWNEYDDDVPSSFDDAVAIGTDGDRRRSDAELPRFSASAPSVPPGVGDAGASSAAAGTWPAFVADVNDARDDLRAGVGSGRTALGCSSSDVIAALAASMIGLSDRAFVRLNRVAVNTSIAKVVVGSRDRLWSRTTTAATSKEAGDNLVTHR